MPPTIVLYRFPHPEFARAVLRGRRFEVRIATRRSQLTDADLVMIEDTRDAAGDVADRRLVRCADPTSARAIVAAVEGREVVEAVGIEPTSANDPA